MWLQNILVFIIYLESRAFGNILSEEKYRIMSAWLHFWHGIRNIVKINLVLNSWTFWRYNILVCSKKYLLALFWMAKINKHWCLHFAKCKVHNLLCNGQNANYETSCGLVLESSAFKQRHLTKEVCWMRCKLLV